MFTATHKIFQTNLQYNLIPKCKLTLGKTLVFNMTHYTKKQKNRKLPLTTPNTTTHLPQNDHFVCKLQLNTAIMWTKAIR